MKKRKIWLIIAVTAGLLAAAAALIFFLPYYMARSYMPLGSVMTLEQQENGDLLLRWPGIAAADHYRVQLLEPYGDEENETVLAELSSESNKCVLPDVRKNEEVLIRVSSAVEYEIPGQKKIRYGGTPLEAIVQLDTPVISELSWKAYPETKSIEVSFSMKEGDLCRCWAVDGEGRKTYLSSSSEPHMSFAFGEGKELAIPSYGTECVLAFDAYREFDGLTFYGVQTAELTMIREDLFGRRISVEFADLGDRCTLNWSETKGDYYEVQMKTGYDREWTSVACVPAYGERSYSSPRLDPCEEYSFRVIAQGGKVPERFAYAAISESFHMDTDESVLYSTVWPVKDMEVFADPGFTEAAGKVKCGRALCVVEEAEGAFGVYLDGQIRYIDSSYCMINLPDYMGRLCSYNITNSYSSLYMVHEYAIPRVTGVVTGGYGSVKQHDGSYIVPLLYPTARKLLDAAKTAREAGYRLKIYDSFRPGMATSEIYYLTEQILGDTLPRWTYTGAYVSLPEPQGDELTYGEVMTGGVYSLSAFLAKGASLHNFGVALDLTLEDAESGKELRMQTSMHDLSFYSASWRNNEAANTLSSIMTGAGFGGLSSEWWHFQDNDNLARLRLSPVWYGLSAEGWIVDDRGYRYRLADGSCYTECTVIIEETEYSFDAEGYLI